MALKTRTDLVNEALANLGVIQQSDSSATYTRAQLVVEALGKLGINYQADAGASRTRSELVNNVAFILGPGQTGNTLSADDYAAIDLRVDTVISDLNARSIATVTSSNAIPAAWFDALSAIVANTCKEKYGVVGDEAAKLAAGSLAAEKRLKNLNWASQVDADLPSIVADLNARGICTVTSLAAIPGAWFHALADIVAARVSASRDVDPAIVQRAIALVPIAERTLKNLTRTYVVDRNVDQILADLAVREIVYLVDVSTIPDEWFIHLTAIVADRCKGKGFDLDPATLARVTAEGRQAIADLRELTRGRPSYLPQQSSYF